MVLLHSETAREMEAENSPCKGIAGAIFQLRFCRLLSAIFSSHTRDQDAASIPVYLPFDRVRNPQGMNMTVLRVALRLSSGFVFLFCSRHDVGGSS